MQILGRDGYLKVGVYYEGKQHTWEVHRLVASAFLGDALGRSVDHLDGNKLNNHYTNLEYVTASVNNQRRREAGHRSQKLNPKIVSEIRKDTTLSNQKWAEKLGVTRYVVRDARRRRTYKHIP